MRQPFGFVASDFLTVQRLNLSVATEKFCILLPLHLLSWCQLISDTPGSEPILQIMVKCAENTSELQQLKRLLKYPYTLF